MSWSRVSPQSSPFRDARALVLVALGLLTTSGCHCGAVALQGDLDAGCTPSPEVCDGLDNDCNGLVDDGMAAQSCGVGACERTVAACLDGSAPICVAGTPTAEVCDGLDNDCNGVVDDGLGEQSCGVGACAKTTPACVDGHVPDCVPGRPTAEVCDGLDNDCNGQVDEGLGQQSCGVGVCAQTMSACADGGVPACVPGVASAETCDGLDNDCNGLVDDGLGQQSCGVGACARTVPSCLDGGVPSCVPGLPTAEVCDGLDNDCNGQVDDGVCLAPVVACGATLGGRAGTTQTLTASATDADGTVVSTSWTVTSRPAGSTAQPASASGSSTDFTPDVGGSYTLQYCATNDRQQTSCCPITFAVTQCTTPPTPPVSTACGTSWDGRPIVQFAPVPTGLTYELSMPDGGTVLASATETQNWLRPATRVAAGGPMPGTPTDLEVRSCRVGDPACCSTPTTLSVNVVEVCTTPTTPTSANVVLSEYVTNGEGVCPSVDCATQDTCQAGESVEITNLSNCPVALNGFHFAYRNNVAGSGSLRWMNFGAGDVIPPRGVYVAMRSMQYAPTCSAGLPPESTALYGLKISALSMEGPLICSGWFNNTGGGLSEMQVAPGTVANAASLGFTPAAAIARVAPYLPSTGFSPACSSIGFDAVDSCGSVVGGTAPTTALSPNQLGRLWHPCDAVPSPVPTCVRN